MLLFFAYPIQGVQTIRYPKTGSDTLLILYGFYGITSLFAAPVIDIVGPEWCMPMGALTVSHTPRRTRALQLATRQSARPLLTFVHVVDDGC